MYCYNIVTSLLLIGNCMSPGSWFQDSWVEQIWEHNESVLNFIILSTLLSQSCERSYIHCYYIYIVRFLNYELHYPCGNEGYFLFIRVFFFWKGEGQNNMAV